MQHPSEYRGKEVVILGLARSGQAAAVLFRQYGADVTINDMKPREQCPEADKLESIGVNVVCGGHPEGIVHPGVALVVKNPGIFYSAPPVVQALNLGIEVVTEVEVAGLIRRANMIGITGSNGKTTTTTWIADMLQAGGKNAIVAGNIGTPLCDAARGAAESDWLVAELSSFQLKGTSRFRPDISCLLNVYETHLDYHGDMDDYIASKLKLFANQTEEDTAVLNYDDDVCRAVAERIRAKVVFFSLSEELPSGLFLSGNTIVSRTPDGALTDIIAADQLGVRGRHNIENALAAAACALAAGAAPQAIAQAMREFRGVEHRLEFVAYKDRIAYYNNSKATNPAATVKAIEAFDEPVILIAGGQDRGSDFSELAPLFATRVKAVVTFGETSQKIAEVAVSSRLNKVKVVDNANNPAAAVESALEAALSYASSGDVILFSPSCASWDMFPSYEERGRMFKQSVHNLL